MGKRTRICRGRGRKKTCFYMVRDKRGRFKKGANIGRSIKADRRVRAKNRSKKPGYGHQGDYRRRRRR